MNDLVGLTEAGEIVGRTRQQMWNLYKAGKIQPVLVLGDAGRRSPYFNRQYIEQMRSQFKPNTRGVKRAVTEAA